jgi:D-glycero-alpha-D-manno-heptose-7-phosphate kinase
MFYTGTTRNAGSILKEQSESIGSHQSKLNALRQMVRLAYNLKDELQANNLDALGDILHENWVLKKSLVANISNQSIDTWYEIARKAGAKGGKILGAGAGGFLLLVAPREKHDEIKIALSTLRAIPVRFDPLGSRIIFYT